MALPARILVVDDNPGNLELMAYLLKAHGYPLLTASSGSEGVRLATTEEPDLVLMDVQMPHMDGFEATEAIRDSGQGSKMRIVAVTALAMVGDRERIIDRGFDGYISKPIGPENFVREVESFLPEGSRAGGGSAPR